MGEREGGRDGWQASLTERRGKAREGQQKRDQEGGTLIYNKI